MKHATGYEGLTDHEIVRLCSAGDLKPFGELLRRYSGPLYQFLYRFLRDPALAQDCVQETFLKVFQNLKRYKEQTKFTTWLYQVAANAAKDTLRYQKRKPAILFSQGIPHEKGTAAGDVGEDPSLTAEEKEKHLHLSREIEDLPPRYRLAVLLRDIQEMPYPEAAQIMECSPEAAKVRVHRARSLLKERLVRNGWYEPTIPPERRKTDGPNGNKTKREPDNERNLS